MTRSKNLAGKIKPKKFSDHLAGKEGQILLATFQCIVEKGIASTSTYAIAAKAGLNQGNIHYHFKSKDELLQRVLDIFFLNAIAHMEVIAETDLGPREKLESFLDFGHSIIVPRKDEWIVFNALWAHAMSAGGKIQQLFRKNMRRFQDVLAKILQEGESSGDFKKGKSTDIALLLIGAVQGLASQYAIDPKRFDPQGPLDFLKELIRDM